MLGSFQDGHGGIEGGPSTNSDPGHRRAVSNGDIASPIARLRIDTTGAHDDFLSPQAQGVGHESESTSPIRPRTPIVVKTDPFGKRTDLHRDDDLHSAHASGKHSPAGFYSHTNGSEHSFASIETVTDLGFTKHRDSSNALDSNAPQPQDAEALHPLRDRSRSNASSVHSDEDVGEITVGTVAKLLRRSVRKSQRADLDFYPISEIQRILTSHNVQQILKEKIPELSNDESKAELDQLTRDICGTPRDAADEQPQCASRQRLFAILLLGGKAQCIRCFVHCGVDDSDLPFVPASHPPDSSIRLYTRTDVQLKQPLKCVSGWEDVNLEWFVSQQYAVLSPFFDLDPENVCLYILTPRIILPFIEFVAAGEGGQASVGKVLIHRAHHNFRSERNPENPYFAVKRLHSHQREDYQKEVEVLQRFSGKNNGHPHLARLLLTYQHGENYHMLFRWADGNLRDFWRSRLLPERTKDLAYWMLAQLHGIADGLRAIHGNIPKAELSPNDKNTGRHGDIKPENILWFKRHGSREDHLLIADFGLSRFHSHKSQSEDKLPGFSPSYRPPECDLFGVSISVKYDIWTLGCLFLDFLTWYLLGFDAVDFEFEDARVSDEKLEMAGGQGIFEDKFFIRYSDGSRVGAELKPSVVNWMEKLHKLDHCPEFVHDLLGIIQNGLLVPDKKLRWDSQRVVDELGEVRQKSNDFETYCLVPQEWKGKAVETRPVLSPIVQYESLFSVVVDGQGQGGPSSTGSPNSEHPSPSSTPQLRRRSYSDPGQELHEQEPRLTATTRTPPPPSPGQDASVVQLQKSSLSYEQPSERRHQLPSIPAAPVLPISASKARTLSGPGQSITTTGTGMTNTTDSQAPLIKHARPPAGKAQRIWDVLKRCGEGICSCFRSTN